MKNKIHASFRITRPVNCLIGGLSILIAAVIARPIQDWKAVWLAVFSGALITAAANVINDWYDIDIDRINRPNRALPSGQLTVKFAKFFAIILFVCGIFFSIFINSAAFGIAAVGSILLVCYSGVLKRTILWGNAAVSLVSGLAFIYGALAAGQWRDGLIPAIFAFLFHFGREILKDIEDVAGDAAMSAVTLPVKYGKKAAFVAITIIYSLLIVATLVPYFMQIYSGTYLIIVLFGVDTVLLATLFALWMQPEEMNLGFYSGILKADMLVGLLAVYLGK